MKIKSYKTTLKACFLGFGVQATVVNLTPVLFIPLRNQFGLSFGQLGLLVFINFITQVLTDISFSHIVDKKGYRRFLVAAHLLSAAGFILFALSPSFFSTPYIGFVIGTIIFSVGGGLLELLISPTVDAIPIKAKASTMSLLHSFYAWGQMAVVIITTLFLLAFGRASWPVIMIIWAIPPVVNALLFSQVPINRKVPEEKREGFKLYMRNKFFIAAFFLILFGAASELVMNQWASAFMEEVMFIPKAVGDISGMSMFALMLGLGRLLHGPGEVAARGRWRHLTRCGRRGARAGRSGAGPSRPRADLGGSLRFSGCSVRLPCATALRAHAVQRGRHP